MQHVIQQRITYVMTYTGKPESAEEIKSITVFNQLINQ